MSNQNNIEVLFSKVQAKTEQLFEINSEYPSMVSVSIFSTDSGVFQASVIHSENISIDEGKYLNLPSWVDKSKWDYHDELYGEGPTVQHALYDLLCQLDTLIDLSKPKQFSPVWVADTTQTCASAYWLVKDSNGQYYKHNENAVHWTQKQKDAQKFTCYNEAKKTSDCLNKQHSVSRVIRIVSNKK